ncbi:MAG: hypothetical protein A2076_09965 [Geobacteraceae bacterium GWC2_53_11]|nr:MAG: hypothetical protein A2076_09965 [Geobacteraceae bacterium GWC2_53_11]
MSPTTGGWTAFNDTISKEAADVFAAAMKGLVGVNYVPLAVATQVVAGINYDFFCNAKVVYPNAPEAAAMVKIYCPPNGVPHLTAIVPVNH